MDERKGYTEQLINYGKLADFWLTEKDLIPKLFQVLVPRYQGQNGNYTRVLQIPNKNKQDQAKMAVIDYNESCFPPLPLMLLNQLLPGLLQDQKQHPQLPHTSNTRNLFNWNQKVCCLIGAQDHRPLDLFISRTGAGVVK